MKQVDDITRRLVGQWIEKADDDYRRYPGDFPDMRPGDEKKAIELARRVRAAEMSRLAECLRGPVA